MVVTEKVTQFELDDAITLHKKWLKEKRTSFKIAYIKRGV